VLYAAQGVSDDLCNMSEMESRHVYEDAGAHRVSAGSRGSCCRAKNGNMLSTTHNAAFESV
jgi:hypothetical protein